MELLKTRDFYADGDQGLVDYLPERVNVLKGRVPCRELGGRLRGEAARCYADPARFIERTEEEMESALLAGELESYRPYWDPVLRSDRSQRLDFFRRMISLGLGTLRARAKGRIGIFFRLKKNGDQRMVVDCLDPNQSHRRAPHSRLGTPAPIAAADLSSSALNSVGENRSDVAPHIATIDLRDSFYQFSVPRLASWFCAPQAEKASVWGVTEVYDEDLDACVHDDTPLFFAVQAMPMGWAWALYFCQSIMSDVVADGLQEARRRSEARGRGPRGDVYLAGRVGGLLRDGEVCPLLARGCAVASVYVDNANMWRSRRPTPRRRIGVSGMPSSVRIWSSETASRPPPAPRPSAWRSTSAATAGAFATRTSAPG